MTRIASFALRAPKLTLLLVAAVTLALGYFARSVDIDGSMEALLADGDPDRAYYDEVERLFGSEEVTVIGVFGDDVFSPATLEKIDRLSTQIADLEGVRQVVSLTTVQSVESDDEGLHVGKLVREIPHTTDEVERLRRRALANPLYLRNLFAADGKAASLTVVYQPMSDRELEASHLEGRIREIVASLGGPESFAVTGAPTLKVRASRFMNDDIATFAPLALLLMTAVLFLAFRTALGVVIPLATVVVGVVWTVGLMALAGTTINLGTLMLPPLLITIGAAWSVHVVSQYYVEIEPGGTAARVATATMEQVAVPLAVCALTTAIALAPFASSPIRAIRDFGVYAIFGVAALLAASFTLAPAALALWPLPRQLRQHAGEDGWLAIFLARIGLECIPKRRLVFLGTALACLVCLLGVRHIRVVTDHLAFFGPTSAVRRDDALIAGRLAGTQSIYVVIDGDGPGSITKLKTLAAMKELQVFLAEQPGVDTTMSLLDYLGLLRHALDAGEIGSLPTTQEEVDQLFLFANPADLEPLVNTERSRANMLLRTTLSGSDEVNDFVRRVDAFAAAHFPRGVTVHPTGSAVLLNRTADTLTRGQISELWQVVAVVFIALSVMFLSLRIGLLSLVPTVVPIILLFGIMGWSGIRLNISTSMFSALAIALSIDGTIHFLSAFNRELRRSGEQEAAVRHAMSTVGRSMVVTAAALAAGFLILCLSEFQPVRHVGLLGSLAVGVTLLVGLLLSPALVTAVKFITLWDLLGLELGPEPQRQIPLFAGLRPFQAKIVVLMAQVGTAPQGTFLTRRGEMREELYVLLNGRADVHPGYGGGLIQSMSRGDVIGEMGLVRRRPRADDVVIAEETEYLTLDGRALARIERRYPRIAAVVLLNLARILSDRLESTTDALGEAKPVQ